MRLRDLELRSRSRSASWFWLFFFNGKRTPFKKNSPAGLNMFPCGATQQFRCFCEQILRCGMPRHAARHAAACRTFWCGRPQHACVVMGSHGNHAQVEPYREECEKAFLKLQRLLCTIGCVFACGQRNLVIYSGGCVAVGSFDALLRGDQSALLIYSNRAFPGSSRRH